MADGRVLRPPPPGVPPSRLGLCLSDGAHAGRPGAEDLDRTVATRVQPGAATQCVGRSPPPTPEGRWCMARSYGTGPPSPERGSRHSVTVGHAEPGHRVENPAGESHLHALPYQRATRHGSADDRLVPIDRVLDHGAPAVACSLGPLAAAEFVDRADVPVPLLQRSRRSWTQLGVGARRSGRSRCWPRRESVV